jgi:DNA repair exonuclease SbcCD ATPase subunit
VADVRFVKIELHGYGPFRDKVEYDLARRGLVALVGENKDDPGASSNGSGKTTLLMAPLWVLTGETDWRPQGGGGRGLRKEVVNEQSERATGRLWLESYGTQLMIERRIGAGGHKLKVEVDGKDQTKQDLAMTQAVIDKYVDTALLSRVIFFGQLDTSSLLDMTDAKRKDLIGRVISLDIWDRASKEAYAKVKAISSKVEQDAGALRMARENLESTKKELGEAQQKLKQHDSQKSGELKKIANSVDRNVRNTVYEIPLEQDDVDELKAIIADAEKVRGQVYSSNERDVMTRVAELKVLAEKWYGQLEQIKADAKRTNDHYANVETGEWLCPTCKQMVRLDEAERDRLLALKEDELKSLRESYVSVKQSHTAAINEYNKANESVERIRQEAEKAKEEHEEAVKAASADVSKANAVLSANSTWVAKSEASNPWVELVASCEAKIVSLQDKIKALEADQEGSADKLSTYNTLKAAFGRNGIQSYVVECALGDLGTRAAGYLDTMTSGYLRLEISGTSETAKGDLREKISFRFWVRRVDGSYVERTIQQLSGGQRRRFTVAMSLAYADFAAERVGLRSNMIVLDEILQHLDSLGRQMFQAAVLDQLGRESVFVISHDAEMTGLFDTVDRVEMSADVARVERG